MGLRDAEAFVVSAVADVFNTHRRSEDDMKDLYITTSIPYVNGSPHLGHALEVVHADVLARHRRQRGATVRLQSGTDDHAIKNVTAAAAAGVPVAEFVGRNADGFERLASGLEVHPDVFLRTSAEVRHRAGVNALWRACRAAGDLYQKDYTGLYCAGCEQFYELDELVDGILCVEHRSPVQRVTETNWFFRLSRYREQVATAITSGQLTVKPVERRNEVLGFLAGEVHDLSVSRPSARAAGWGIQVPDDPDQVVYVWFDALANYITGLGYGSDDHTDYRRWWTRAVDRTHVIGKGIVRFHAIYWIAFLLSAGLELPSRILVHDYLTVDGEKIAKSGAHAHQPEDLVLEYGVDALRWWLLRDPAPVGTTDFTIRRLVATYNRDLANSVGNLASRTTTLARKQGTWRSAPGHLAETSPRTGISLQEATHHLPGRVDTALDHYDFRSAGSAITELAEEGNRFIEAEAPWHLARVADMGDDAAARRFEAVIALLLTSCRAAARELEAFLPSGATRLLAHLEPTVQAVVPVFPRLHTG